MKNELPVGDCKKDYKGSHYWEKIGIEKGYLFWRCTQCRLFFKERMKFYKKELKGVERCGVDK